MIDLLEVPAIRRRAKLLSIAEYRRWTEGQPTELLRGIVIEKMAKSPLHRFLAHQIRDHLVATVPPDYCVFQEGPITTADSEPEPDVAVVHGASTDYRDRHPETASLVIEIAISSLEIDRVKALIYAEAGVNEYWIVCPEEKCVEVYRQPRPEGYADRLIITSGVLESSALPGVRIDLATLFA